MKPMLFKFDNHFRRIFFNFILAPFVVLFFATLALINLWQGDYPFFLAGFVFAIIVAVNVYASWGSRDILRTIKFSLTLNFTAIFGLVALMFLSGRRELDPFDIVILLAFLLFYLVEVISQERNAREQAEELTKLKLAVDDAYDHIVITDPDGYILYANKEAERITGYTFKEMRGEKPALWGRQMDKEFYEHLWKTIKTEKKKFIGELTNKRKNGEIYFAEIRVSPILDRNNNVKFFVGIERDITKEKEIDRMKTEFISLTSHQLMTPLTAMKWYLDFLSSERFGKLNKKQKEFVRRLTLSNEGMIKLVSALLNIARLESGRILVEPRPTDLYALVREVVQELEPKIKSKKQRVNIAAGQKIPLLNLDDNLIRNVYMNLLTNAIKYTPKGASIGIEIKTSDRQVVSQVSDTGYGIPSDEQEKVFQKFFRAGNIRKIESDGTGLGLYLVKLIVEMAGGKIWFKSEEGKGTTFWFSLPLSGMEAKKGEITLSTYAS